MQQWWKVKGEEPEPENSNESGEVSSGRIVIVSYLIAGLSIAFYGMNKHFQWGISTNVMLFMYSVIIFGALCWMNGVFSKKISKKKQKRKFILSVLMISIALISGFGYEKYKSIRVISYSLMVIVIYLWYVFCNKQDEKEKLKGGNENE